MPSSLPTHAIELLRWDWADYQPFYQTLQNQNLTAQNVEDWLKDWSRLSECINEQYNRLYVAMTASTADQAAEQRFQHYLDSIYPPKLAAEQALKEKLLASGLQPAGFELPLRCMRSDAERFRQQNIPLLALDEKLANEYNQIVGAQTVTWQGVETTLPQLKPVFQNPDRQVREQAWRLGAERQLADREALNDLWRRLLSNRLSVAANADLPSYRDYRWSQMYRFDYTPADCRTFHEAIERVVVPAARRAYKRRQQRLGVKTLRPWDLEVDPLGRPALRPFQTATELRVVASRVFHQVDPVLGGYFDQMTAEGLLDLENRKNKAPGAYCTDYPAIRRPFIFMNAVGIHDDVQTLLHEGGHAFHVFESAHLPYYHQMAAPMEFAEVASMGMEFLAMPYLDREQGGYYSRDDAARARVEHLESSLLFWAYMAVVDAFQHWVYENPQSALQPAACDAAWGREWQRFMAGVDWSGLEAECVTGWQRKLHIFLYPLYYVEYGLAQLGAVQVWLNASKNRSKAVAAYRRALALGGTASLPLLFQAAGATFGFDATLLGKAVKAMETAIAASEAVQ